MPNYDHANRGTVMQSCANPFKFVRLLMKTKDIGRYTVYEDGRVFSHISNKFLSPDMVQGYKQYSLYIDGKQVRKKAHQLVARCFIPNDDPKKNMINHIDGNKLNNTISNLEWCTAYENNKHARDTGLNNVSESDSKRWEDPEFRKKTSENISKGLLKAECNKDTNNPRYRYEIMAPGEERLSRTELAAYLGIAQSTADTIIREACNCHVSHLLVENGITVTDLKG